MVSQKTIGRWISKAFIEIKIFVDQGRLPIFDNWLRIFLVSADIIMSWNIFFASNMLPYLDLLADFCGY